MRFTIRDLFLLTLILAILTAWWLDRSRLNFLWKSAETESQKSAAELKAATAQPKEARDYIAAEGAEIQRLDIRWSTVKGKLVLRPPPYYGDSPPATNPAKNLPNTSALAPNPPKL